MIRITASDESSVTRLVLEGKLAGPSVCELEKCWLSSTRQEEIVLDLTSVSFIDDRGKELLRRMHEKGTRLVSARLLTRCLIEELERKGSSL